MGFRSDVADFYDAADVYVLPSIREGLNVSLMEAMASGLSCVCSQIRGNVDLIDDNNCLFAPTACKKITAAIRYAIKNRERLGKTNQKKMQMFDLQSVRNYVRNIYMD